MTGSSSSEESQAAPTPQTRAAAETLASTNRTSKLYYYAAQLKNVTIVMVSNGTPLFLVVSGSGRAAPVRPAPDDLITPEPSATPTETGGESSIVPDTDTGSELSAGFNEAIGNLRSLRREVRDNEEEEEDDDQSTTVTETSSVDDREEGMAADGGSTMASEIRQRKLE